MISPDAGLIDEVVEGEPFRGGLDTRDSQFGGLHIALRDRAQRT